METKLVHNSREAQELGGGVPHSLRSASVLMYGCVVVYSKKIEFLKDESQHALTTIQQARLHVPRRPCSELFCSSLTLRLAPPQSSVAASVDLPPNAAGNASAVTLAPASEVDYDYLARLDRNAGAFRFNRECADPSSGSHSACSSHQKRLCARGPVSSEMLSNLFLHIAQLGTPAVYFASD